jgi:hypothetical protein
MHRQKISDGFCSEAGAQRFCRIRGDFSTLRNQDVNVLDALLLLVLGDPVPPIASAESLRYITEFISLNDIPIIITELETCPLLLQCGVQ